METILMVTEKPSIAETIANILSPGKWKKRKGISSATSVWEFNWFFKNKPAFFKVTSTVGHIYTTDFPKQYNNWDAVDPIELFSAEVIKVEANPSTRICYHLSKEAEGCNHLILCLDCDREGENICFEVIKNVVYKLKNKKNIWRARFSALSSSDILKAMENLGMPNENEAEAVDGRQELDLKVGCAFTRFQTKYFQGKYGDLDSSLVSYGPCQTPTLQFCVKRYDDIQAFQPELYYILSVELKIQNEIYELKWKREKVFDKSVANIFQEIVSKKDSIAIVENICEKVDKRIRPEALNTVALLKNASQLLNIGPHQTMQIAERLYLAGFITYPRTETNKYPPSFNIKNAVNEQKNNALWGFYAQELLEKGIGNPRGGYDAGDHPPITPVKSATESQIGSADGWRIYEYICRHFLSSVGYDCVFLSKEFIFIINNEIFSLFGRYIIDSGFTKVLKYGEMKDISLPNFNIGDQLPVHRAILIEKTTSPPPYLSESELISFMEKYGIGTDASMATHIQNIVDRNYVTLVNGRRLQPTKLGIALVHGYMMIDDELVLPSVRASIESLVDLIAKGKAKMRDAVNHSLGMFCLKFQYFLKKIEYMDNLFEASFTLLSQSGSIISKCGICKRYMNLINKRPVRLHCQQCSATYAMPQGGTIKLYKELKCPLDDFELVLFSIKGGKSYPLCPMCYNDPPFEMPQGKKMSCLECKHPTCRHSLNAQGVCQCPQPQCTGILCLDVVSSPKWKMDCNKCNYQVKLLENAHKISVTSEECQDCGSALLQFIRNKIDTFKDGSLEKKGCIICDTELNSIMESTFSKIILTNHRSGRGKGRGGGRGRGGRGRGRRGRRGGRAGRGA